MTAIAPAAPPAGRPPPDPPVVVVPREAHTWHGYRAWAFSDAFPVRGRIAYIGGDVHVDLTPERLNSHAGVRMAIGAVLSDIIRGERSGLFLPHRTLISNEPADLSNEPDAGFVSKGRLTDGRATLVRTADGSNFQEVIGSVDMVLEVVTPSSLDKDTRLLYERYYAAGVGEYWLVDARGDEILFHLYRHTPDGFVNTEARDGWLPSAVFDREFRLTRERSPSGLWDYTLHTRPLGGS